MILKGRVSDHAFMRWLERAKGLNIQALEAEFVALCLPIVESGASGGWIEGNGYKVWLAIKDGMVVTTTPDRPQRHKKFVGKQRIKRERQLIHREYSYGTDNDRDNGPGSTG